MGLTEHQAVITIALLTSRTNLINQEIGGIVDAIGRAGDFSSQEQDELCVAMAQLESYSACIVLLLRYLPDNEIKEELLKITKANLRQTKHFFDETEVSYGTYDLQPNGIN